MSNSEKIRLVEVFLRKDKEESNDFAASYGISSLHGGAFLRKKVWVTTPVVFVMNLLLFLMAGVSWFFNKYIFIIELFFSLLMLIFSIKGKIGLKRYVQAFVDDIVSLQSDSSEFLNLMPFPGIVVGEYGEILFANELFKSVVTNDLTCVGEAAEKFLENKKIDFILEKNGVDISFKGKRYTVYGVKSAKALVLYFIEDTYYKETTFEYLESRPTVMFITFDNKEEILRDIEVEQSSQVVAKVEQQLQNWAKGSKGIFRKLNENLYMMIVEERYVKSFVNEKFNILEAIRNVKLDENKYATVSIGVGREAKGLYESELWAKKALEMALGRGGDQAVVKQNNNYAFFGGISKGTEKLEKVRTRVIANTLIEHIRTSDNVLIMGHKYSDLDSVGACIGMWSALTKGQKKTAHIVLNETSTLAESLVVNVQKSTEEKVFINASAALNIITDKTLLIIVDTHSPNFIEDLEVYQRCKRIVVIDHHRMMVNHIDDALVFYHEPSASSSSEMVTELIQYFGENFLNSVEAEALLSGIMLDTKNFVLKTGVRTFEAAAFLRKKGANTVAVKRLFSNTITTYKEKYQLVSSAEIFNNCAISVAQKEMQDIRVASAQAADELLDIQGVRASFVIYFDNDVVNVSARSMGDVNVQPLMEKLGGGGHQTMAGAQIKNISVEQVREKIIEMITAMK